MILQVIRWGYQLSKPFLRPGKLDLLFHISRLLNLHAVIIDYSKTSLIQAAWDQGVPVIKKMPPTEKYVYCV